MKNQKIVEIENDNIHMIYDGSFERWYLATSQSDAWEGLLKQGGTDFREFISKLEKVIIGCYRRHPEDEEYFKEMMPNRWFENTKEYYLGSAIKTRTEKEKVQIVDKIMNNKY